MPILTCPFFSLHSVTSIIFCAALSDYDQVLEEERRVVSVLFLRLCCRRAVMDLEVSGGDGTGGLRVLGSVMLCWSRSVFRLGTSC
jgi:hypothetical protein